MTRIALNGLGRIENLSLRRLVDEGMGDRIVLLNDVAGDAAQHALLMEFDSVQGGSWPMDHLLQPAAASRRPWRAAARRGLLQPYRNRPAGA